MQRAAASASISTSTFPTSQSSMITTANDSSGDTRPSPKRQRLADQSPSLLPSADLQAISAAVKVEEERRAVAVARQAAEAGETEWVLEFPAGNEGRGNGNGTGGISSIVRAEPSRAFGIDADMDYGGRRSYGNFNPKNSTDVRIPHCLLHQILRLL